MKGMELAEAFFKNVLFPLIQSKEEEILEHAAFGLVGAGSECLGFDDHYSQDHDFTPLCCIWIGRADMKKYGSRMKRLLSELPYSFQGFPVFPEGGITEGRKGVLERESFYYGFLGCQDGPQNLEEWNRIPEHFLSMAVSGKVFWDQEGTFTAVREKLLAYYPSDVWLHRMAFCCTKIAQAGQYNFPRCVRREENIAAELSKAEFLQYAIQMVYLLNRRYCPFYKWMHHGLPELPILGERSWTFFTELTKERDAGCVYERIEDFCGLLFTEMQRQFQLQKGSGFFLEYADELQSRIQDDAYRRRGPWAN